MRLRLILVSFLLLPAVALGPGWSLRYCVGELWGGGTCCGVAEPSCCSNDEAPADRSAEHGPRDGCDACCLDIDTSREQPAPATDSLERELKRAELAIWTVSLVAPAARVPERSPWAWSRPPPSTDGRAAPLPLRI